MMNKLSKLKLPKWNDRWNELHKVQKKRKNSESTIDIFTEKERKIEQLCTLSMRNMCIYICVLEKRREKTGGKQIILCRQNCNRVLVSREDRNYGTLIGDGLRIFIFVNETLTPNFRRILTFSLSLFPILSQHSPDGTSKAELFSPVGWYSLTVFNLKRCVGDREINVPCGVISFIRKARNEGKSGGSPWTFRFTFRSTLPLYGRLPLTVSSFSLLKWFYRCVVIGFVTLFGCELASRFVG